MGEDWFGTLLNGGLGAYQATVQADAAIATADAQAKIADQRRVEMAQQQTLSLMTASKANSNYVLWGMGLFAMLFIVRATNRG